MRLYCVKGKLFAPTGERNHLRGQTTCTSCDNAPKNIEYTIEFEHKIEEKCQVCLNYQVANSAKNACMPCPPVSYLID